MSKKQPTSSKPSTPGYTYVQTVAGVEEYRLKSNDLRVLYLERPGTEVVTTNITYLVGARDEERGETGVAHMLEHMLFKATTFDKARKSGPASMLFERETGCVLNANTWKDRTTYYFTYPTEYLERAVQIEAERMTGTILTDEELLPERNNVLSEFDMNNGDPYFALSVQMVSVALQSHPYGHETIGYREDIEQYTAETLEKYYRNYYRPDNAVMMVIGDVNRSVALQTVRKHFESIKNPTTQIPRYSITEPKQEGQRRVSVRRPANSTLLGIGFINAGFPSKDWFTTALLLEMLVGDEESILHKKFIDTGKVSSASSMIEPTRDKNLGALFFSMPKTASVETIEHEILSEISKITVSDLQKLLQKTRTRMLTEELFARDHSQRIAQELTEYVASQNWTMFAKTEEILHSISATDIHEVLTTLFSSDKLIIGTYQNS